MRIDKLENAEITNRKLEHILVGLFILIMILIGKMSYALISINGPQSMPPKKIYNNINVFEKSVLTAFEPKVYKTVEVFFNKYVNTKQIIISDMHKHLIISTLLVGWKEYDIDPRIVLNIIWLESQLTYNAINYNRNGTIDYGYAQINNANWDVLSKRSMQVLKEHKVWFDVNLKYFDPALNIMNAIIYLNDTRNILEDKKEFSSMRWIQAYNTGINGSVSQMDGFVKARERYWNGFIKNYEHVYASNPFDLN